MHLACRSGTQRPFVQVQKDIIHFHTQRVLDDPRHLLEAERRDITLKFLQFFYDIFRNHVRSGTGNLAELDESRAHLFDEQPYAFTPRFFLCTFLLP